ncbi:ribonuclease H-like domain-containing protein [Linnemannia elongata]|nr:ribonuclease H-like domain-containing protein [Linnemannia elongata]
MENHKSAIDTIHFPSVTFDNNTAKNILATRFILESQHGMHHLFSDGSLQYFRNINIRMSFAVAFKGAKGKYDVAVTGTADGYATSTRAEIVGILATILCCPRDQPATIYTDDQSAVHEFSALVQSSTTTQQPILSPNADWWRVVKIAYIQQGRQITVHWVRGHSGVAGNVAADRLADKAHTTEFASWHLSQH